MTNTRRREVSGRALVEAAERWRIFYVSISGEFMRVGELGLAAAHEGNDLLTCAGEGKSLCARRGETHFRRPPTFLEPLRNHSP